MTKLQFLTKQNTIILGFLEVLGNEILNMWFKGSKSIIIAITSTWQSFAWPLVSTNNAKIFTDFATKLLISIKLDLGLNLSVWVIILDNFSIHKTKACFDILEKSRAKVAFIPSYTPSLAPIELIFDVLKRFLNKQWKNKTTILNKPKGLRESKEAQAVIYKSIIF